MPHRTCPQRARSLRAGCAAAIGLLAGATISAGGEAVNLTRESCVARVLAQHPALQIARFEVDKAEARRSIAGRLANPSIEVNAGSDFAGDGAGEGTGSLAISQAFPLTARLSRAREVTRVQVALARAEVEEQARRLAVEAEETFVRVLGARLQADAKRRARRLNDELVGFLEDRAGVGEVSPLDVGQAKLASEVLALAIRNLESIDRAGMERLKALAGIDPGIDLRLNGVLGVTDSAPLVPGVDDAVLQRRPGFRLALLRADEARAELALAEASRWEDVVVRLFVEREAAVDEPGGLDRNTFLGLGVSVPLPLWRTGDRLTAAPRATVAQSQAGIEAEARRIRGEVAEATVRARESWSIASLSGGPVLALARKNYEALRSAHAQGQVAFVDVQRAQERMIELETVAVESAQALALAEIELRAALGDGPWNHVTEDPLSADASKSPSPSR